MVVLEHSPLLLALSNYFTMNVDMGQEHKEVAVKNKKTKHGQQCSQSQGVSVGLK